MIEGMKNDFIVGFNVVLDGSDSNSFKDGKKKTLDCIDFVNSKTSNELENCSENYYKEFAEKSAFEKQIFTKVTLDHLFAYPDCRKELSNLSFIIEGSPKNKDSWYFWNDIDFTAVISNLTKLFYSVTGIPLGIHLVVFPSKGEVSWVHEMFSFIDNNNFQITDFWDSDFYFDYAEDEDLNWGVVSWEEFEQWNENTHKRILRNLRTPEKSWFYSQAAKFNNCKKIISDSFEEKSILDDTANALFQNAKKYAKDRKLGSVTPEILMISMLSSKQIQGLFDNYKTGSARELLFELEMFLNHNKKQTCKRKKGNSDDCFSLIYMPYKSKVSSTKHISVSVCDLLGAIYKCESHVSKLIRSIIPDQKFFDDLMTVNTAVI